MSWSVGCYNSWANLWCLSCLALGWKILWNRSIVRKPLHNIPPRLQRMMMRSQGYWYTQYKPGKGMVLVAALGRLPTPQGSTELLQDIQVHCIHTMGADFINISRTNFPLDKQEPPATLSCSHSWNKSSKDGLPLSVNSPMNLDATGQSKSNINAVGQQRLWFHQCHNDACYAKWKSCTAIEAFY